MDQIYGHLKIKQSLLHAVSVSRLHHALMFAGPVGVGKSSLALAFIKMLVCDKSNLQNGILSSCGQCDSCLRMDSAWLKLDNNFFSDIDDPISGFFVKEGFPNLFMIDEPGTIIKVGAIRALRKKLSETPYIDQKPRFVLIRDAHKMQDASANALLKTLEEPNADTSFILTTSKVQSILPTIISRCQVVRFAPFETSEVESWLKSRHPQTPDYEIAQYATLASGSLGEAEKFLAKPDAKKKSKEDDDEDATDNGSSDGQSVIQYFQNIILLRNSSEAMTLAAQMKGKKSIVEPLTRLLTMFLRDILLRQSAPDAPVMIRHHIDIIDSCAARARSKDVMRALDNVQDLYNAFMRNANEQIAWERLLLGFCGVIYSK